MPIELRDVFRCSKTNPVASAGGGKRALDAGGYPSDNQPKTNIEEESLSMLQLMERAKIELIDKEKQ
ncbi:MAG: hypothetical protein ABIR47_16970 [Candidatus Kapaibacterium sp.]